MAFDGRNFLERADLAPHAVDDHAPGAVLAHQKPVIALLDARLPDDRPAFDVLLGKLGIADFTDISEQMRRKRVRRIAPRGDSLHDDIRELEVETPGRHGGHLRQRGVLHHDDRPIHGLAPMSGHHVANVRLFDSHHSGEQAHGTIEVLGVLANDGNVERVAILHEGTTLAVEQNAARRSKREHPLMIVLGQLLEARVLDDLEVPEAQPKGDEYARDGVLKNREAEADCSVLVLHQLWTSDHSSADRRICTARSGAAPGTALPGEAS